MAFDVDESKTFVCDSGHTFQIVGADSDDTFKCQESGCYENAYVMDY